MVTRADLIEVGPLTFAGVVSRAVQESGAGHVPCATCPPELLAVDHDLAVREFAEALKPCSSLILLHPELTLLEALAALGYPGRIVTIVPDALPASAFDSLRRNVPACLDCDFQPPTMDAFKSVRPVRAKAVCVGITLCSELHAVPMWARDALGVAALHWFGATTLLDICSVGTASDSSVWSLFDGSQFDDHVLASAPGAVDSD